MNVNVLFAFTAPRAMKDWLKGAKFEHCSIAGPTLLIHVIVLLHFLFLTLALHLNDAL